MADVELDHLRDGRDRPDRLVVDAVAGVDLEAQLMGFGGGGLEARQQRFGLGPAIQRMRALMDEARAQEAA